MELDTSKLNLMNGRSNTSLKKTIFFKRKSYSLIRTCLAITLVSADELADYLKLFFCYDSPNPKTRVPKIFRQFNNTSFTYR